MGLLRIEAIKLEESLTEGETCGKYGGEGESHETSRNFGVQTNNNDTRDLLKNMENIFFSIFVSNFFLSFFLHNFFFSIHSWLRENEVNLIPRNMNNKQTNDTNLLGIIYL